MTIQIKLPESVLVKSQTKTLEKTYTEGGTTFRIRAEIRFDDQCGNGHNTFAITGSIDEKLTNGRWRDVSGGCIHDDIVKHFPKLAPLIKWHLTSTDGPMHYPSNVLYHAGNRDCWGKLKGEPRQYQTAIQFGDFPMTFTIHGDKFYAFLQAAKDFNFQIIAHAHDKDPKTYGTHYTFNGFGERWYDCPFRTLQDAEQFLAALQSFKPKFVKTPSSFGEGKIREFDHARSSAVWPEATDEQLSAEPEVLKQVLIDRLPALMEEFKAAVESLEFKY